MSQTTDAVIAELMDRRLLNDVDDDLHQEIAEAVIQAARLSRPDTAEARLREALDITRNALVVMRARLRTEPTVQGRGWVDLGIVVNDAIEEADNALSPPSGGDEAKESEGGVEGHARYGAASDTDLNLVASICGKNQTGDSDVKQAGIESGPSEPSPPADRREIVAREADDEFHVIPGFEDYEISRDCRLRRVVPISTTSLMPRFLRARPTPEGYLKYTLRVNGKTRSVIAHRAVALAWLGLPPDDKPCVAHLDNVRSNNNADNLRWVSYQENEDHKKAHGTYRQGTACISSRLNDDIVLDARKRHAKGGVTIKDLAVEYKVRITTMADAVLGRSWKHLPMFEVERHPALDGGRDA